MKKIQAAFLLFFITAYCLGQRDCGTREYMLRHPVQMNTNISLQARVARDTFNDETIIVPVVVHVIYKTPEQNISDAQVISQIEALNKDFGRLNADAVNTPEAFAGKATDTKIRFCLAKVSPNGKLTNGIIRTYTPLDFFSGDDGMKFKAAGGQDAWDANRYLNIWVCKMAGRSLGYATPPGGPIETDGVVISYDVFGTKGSLRAPFNKGRTATHEIGHWMGLQHIWGDDLCGNDGIDDTPPQRSYNFGCPSFPRLSTCSVSGDGDMFMNFMDFVDDACMNMFTTGQKNKMRACFALNATRNGFLDPSVCDSSSASGGPLPTEEGAPLPEIPEERILVQPNPAHEFIQLSLTSGGDFNDQVFDVISIQGKRMMTLSNLNPSAKVNLSSLPTGMYVIKTRSSAFKPVRFIKL